MVHCTTWRSIVKFSAKITGAPRLFPLPTPEKNCFFWGGEGRDLANEIDSCQFIFWLVTLSSTFLNNLVFIAFARNNYCNNLPYLPSILASKKPAVFVASQPAICTDEWSLNSANHVEICVIVLVERLQIWSYYPKNWLSARKIPTAWAYLIRNRHRRGKKNWRVDNGIDSIY